MSVLSQPHFHNEAKAYEFLESVVWAGGIVCPHCGVVGGRVYDLSGVRGSKSVKNPEKQRVAIHRYSLTFRFDSAI